MSHSKSLRIERRAVKHSNPLERQGPKMTQRPMHPAEVTGFVVGASESTTPKTYRFFVIHFIFQCNATRAASPNQAIR